LAESGVRPIPPPTPPPPPKEEVSFSGNAANWAVPDADPNEEPPEPEGHPLSKEVAAWINHGQEFFHGPLPPDIAGIWAHPPMRVSDEATARILISVWGMDEFRGSALHQAALQDRAHQANLSEVTARFKAEREKKGAKR
jgi:hypothetical protein